MAQNTPAGYHGAQETDDGVGTSHGCFASNAAAGKAMLLSATTGNQPTLWNPDNSGVRASLRTLTLTWMSGTVSFGAFHWCLTQATGSAIGTGLPIVTFTQITQGTYAGATGAFAGSGLGSNNYTPRCKWAPAVNTFVAAPTYFRSAGASAGAFAEATAAFVPPIVIPIDGAINLWPGTAITLTYSVTSSTALFHVALDYDEIITG